MSVLFDLGSLGSTFGPMFNNIGQIFSGLFSGEGSLGQSLSNPSQWWDYFKNGRTNTVNQEIANQNLDYQRERNTIEDARYEEETAYNRAFAEDERAYNRALQEKLFEREDTAFLRQAEQLSQLGINPLSQQLNGAGAGQVVGSAVAPGASARGGTALNNDFKMQDMGIMSALAPLASLANTINQVATGQGQRDLLQTQIDKQKLENAITAHDYGIDLFGTGKNRFVGQSYIGDNDYGWKRSKGWKNDVNYGNSYSSFYNGMNTEREYLFKTKNGIYDNQPEFAKNLNYMLSDSFQETAEKALTKGSKLFDKALENSDSKMKDYNPFRKFMELFW